jgi:TonB family protein
MMRYIVISIVGHILVFVGLLVAPLISNRPAPAMPMVTIRMVTPQSIDGLLARNGDVGEPAPKTPQVQIEKDKLIPEPTKKTKKVQTIKRAAVENAAKAPEGGKKDPNAKEQSIPGVDTDQKVDIEYLRVIYNVIRSNWKFPSRIDPNAKAVVYFQIARDGKIMKLFVKTRSNDRPFDQSAWEAVRSSNPFPPLPANFTNDRLGVHLTFTY